LFIHTNGVVLTDAGFDAANSYWNPAPHGFQLYSTNDIYNGFVVSTEYSPVQGIINIYTHPTEARINIDSRGNGHHEVNLEASTNYAVIRLDDDSNRGLVIDPWGAGYDTAPVVFYDRSGAVAGSSSFLVKSNSTTIFDIKNNSGYSGTGTKVLSDDGKYKTSALELIGAGTNAATATVIVPGTRVVTVNAVSTGTGFKLPPGEIGEDVTIINEDNNAEYVYVYTSGGDVFNADGATVLKLDVYQQVRITWVNASFAWVHTRNNTELGNVIGFNVSTLSLNTYYTNSQIHSFVSSSFTLTSAVNDLPKVGLYIDSDYNGTWDQTGVIIAGSTNDARSIVLQLSGWLSPGARFVFTNLSDGSATATIINGSSQWVKR
jgi:hypothetical protein